MIDKIIALVGILICIGFIIYCSIEENRYRKSVDKRLKELERKEINSVH